MTVQRAEYRAEVRLVVDAPHVGDADLLDVPITLPVKKGELSVTISRTPTGTGVKLLWVFEDWFSEDSGQSWEEKSWELWERSGVLFLPDEKGSVEFGGGLAVGELMFEACGAFLARLALASRSPYFWSRVRSADLHDLQGEVTIDVAGHHVRLRPQMWRVLPDVRPAPITSQRAIALARAPFPRYASFFLTADRRFLEGDFADAVVHLAQGVEVAAYAYVRTKIGGVAGEWHFSPSEFFGPRALRRAEITAINPAPIVSYATLCELFGARHEWVHEGRRRVRLFDPAADRCPKGGASRELVRGDYYTFRSAASQALVWMGEEPIE